MVIKNELNKIINILKANGNDNAIFEAHLIVRHYLNLSPMDLILNSENEIGEASLKLIDDAVERRIKHEPIQYILNSQEFMGLDFYVDKNVLVPRADTETLVEHILTEFSRVGFSALDIGTGSGCIAISLAHFNKRAYVRGIDISEKAVEIAQKNAEANNVKDRVCFETADIFAYSSFGKYDLIVSNPPYIETDVINTLETDVKQFEPHTALDGGADGLEFYRHITALAPKLLNAGGMLAYEIGYDQGDKVSEILKKDFKDISVIKDLCGNDRVVSGILK